MKQHDTMSRIDSMGGPERLRYEAMLAPGRRSMWRKRLASTLLCWAAEIAPGIYGLLVKRAVTVLHDELHSFQTTGEIKSPLRIEPGKQMNRLHYLLTIRDQQIERLEFSLAQSRRILKTAEPIWARDGYFIVHAPDRAEMPDVMPRASGEDRARAEACADVRNVGGAVNVSLERDQFDYLKKTVYVETILGLPESMGAHQQMMGRILAVFEDCEKNKARDQQPTTSIMDDLNAIDRILAEENNDAKA